MWKNHKIIIYSFIAIIFMSGSLLSNDTLVVDELVIDSNITDKLDEQFGFLDSITTAQDSIDFVNEILAPIIPEKTGFIERLIADEYLILVVVVLLILYLLFLAFRRLTSGIKEVLVLDSNLPKGDLYDLKEKMSNYSATKNTLKFLIPGILLLYLLYIAVVGTSMQGYVMEWLNLLVRWAHVVAGIMWIGASFYFVFLENNLNRTDNIRDELAGNLWAVHGGGFYFLEKYKVAPKKIPTDLHWFKYEAYFTFITGILLLVIVYYLNPKAYLIDPSVAEISTQTAIATGIGLIILGWLIYDLMCKSPLIKKPVLFSISGFIILTAMAYLLTHLFNSRAAFIHLGAIIGGIMVANVYFNIIPAQKAMVKSATIGEPLDASLGIKAGQRSYHNNYFTLPVIFIMISNHFPSTFGHEYNWAVLAIIALTSAGIKHFWNLAEKGIVKNRILVISLVGLFGLAFVISPAFEAKIDLAIPVSFQEANEIIQTRCVTCHSANPSDDIWKSAPNGVMYDTPEQIKFMSDKIMTRAVRSKTMPQGNKTKMTDKERKVLKRWIMQGSKIDQ